MNNSDVPFALAEGETVPDIIKLVETPAADGTRSAGVVLLSASLVPTVEHDAGLALFFIFPATIKSRKSGNSSSLG